MLRLLGVGRVDSLWQSLFETLRGGLLDSLGDERRTGSVGFVGVGSRVSVVDLDISVGTPKVLSTRRDGKGGSEDMVGLESKGERCYSPSWGESPRDLEERSFGRW